MHIVLLFELIYIRYLRILQNTKPKLVIEKFSNKKFSPPTGPFDGRIDFDGTIKKIQNNAYQILAETQKRARSQCDCPPECSKTSYDIKINTAKVSEEMQTFWTSRVGQDRLEQDRYALHNTVELHVYYSTLSYISEEQEPAYSFEKLLCDIGGAAGLFLGASFLTAIELMDFFFYVMLMISVKKCKRRGKNDVSIIKTNN